MQIKWWMFGIFIVILIPIIIVSVKYYKSNKQNKEFRVANKDYDNNRYINVDNQELTNIDDTNINNTNNLVHNDLIDNDLSKMSEIQTNKKSYASTDMDEHFDEFNHLRSSYSQIPLKKSKKTYFLQHPAKSFDIDSIDFKKIILIGNFNFEKLILIGYSTSIENIKKYDDILFDLQVNVSSQTIDEDDHIITKLGVTKYNNQEIIENTKILPIKYISIHQKIEKDGTRSYKLIINKKIVNIDNEKIKKLKSIWINKMNSETLLISVK